MESLSYKSIEFLLGMIATPMPVFDMKSRSPSNNEDLTLDQTMSNESMTLNHLVSSHDTRSIDEQSRSDIKLDITSSKGSEEPCLGSRMHPVRETELILTDEERDHYYEMFRSQPHVHGFLEGNRAKALLMESGLSTDVLGHIW